MAPYQGAPRAVSLWLTAPEGYYTMISVRVYEGQANAFLQYGEDVPSKVNPPVKVCLDASRLS